MADKWLHFIDGVREASTWDRYDSALKHVLPVFGSREIGSITRGDVPDFLAQKIGEGHSKSGIRLMRDVISGIFAHAIDDEFIAANPCEGVTKRLNLQVKSKKVKPAEVLNEEEIELFLDTCHEHFRKYHLFMLMACRTGMRKGELLGVHWSDIDFNSNFIAVRRQCHRGQFKKPKGGKTGNVEMSAQLREALFKAKKVISLKGDPELIFHSGGKPWAAETVRKVFKKILKKAGLRDLKFHSLRHSCASILLSKGANVMYVAKQLRHSNPHITLTVYAHWVKTDAKSEVSLLDSPSRGCSEVQNSAPNPPKTANDIVIV